MSNKKISQFPVVTTLNGTTYVPVIQGSPLFDAIISASNFAASMQDYNDNYYIKVDGTNSDIEYLNFNPDAVGDPQPYVRKWSATDGTFVFGLPDGGIIQEGKELFDYYVNADTVPLVNGDVVSIVPISGNRKAIARTNVTNAQSAKNAIGMVTVPSIAVGATGRVTKFGEVHDLLTSLYPDGTELFVSESNAGKWATVGATPPNYTVKIGTVIVSQNGNGIVELGIQCFPKLGDLSDVNGVSSSVNKPIVRKADGVIDAINTGLDINGITPSSGTTTITGDLSVDDITSDVVGANTVNATNVNTTNIESANGFVKTGSSDNQVLLGAGGTKNVADFQLKSEKGQANGYASLGADGLVPATQLPSFVDDVIEVANYAALPVTGETGKIYVTLDTNKTYRWSGSTYVYITSGAVDSVAGKTGVVTLVKADVGLANVDNTSDANKPISTATQTALNGKVNNTGDETIAGVKTFSSSPIVPNPTTSGQAMNKGTADGTYVALTGNQTIAGVKTFSSSPVVPTPTFGTDAANKDYVTSSVIGAMPVATAKLEPQLAYYTRVLADSGIIKDLDRLTELYMNQLNLLPYTHFMWDGNAGYKVVDGKLTKAYDMSPNANDGTTSAGTEPYAGGLIAPNESVKIKALIAENRNIALTSEFLKSSSDRWSVTFVANIIKTGNISIIFGKNGFGFFGISSSGNFIFYNQSETLYAFSTSALPYINKNTTFSLIGFGSQIGLYINGNLVESKDCVASISISYILNYDNNVNSGAYNFIGHIPYFQAITKSLSAYEIQLQHELLCLQHPEIEGIDIGNQHWATSNYEGVVTGNGTVIPEYKYTAANSPELITNAADREFTSDTGWWTKKGDTLISGEVCTFTGLGILGSSANNWNLAKFDFLTLGRSYKITIDARLISGTAQLYVGNGYAQTNVTITSLKTTYTVFFNALIYNEISIGGDPTTVYEIDNVSVKEAGWDELTTPGWCYYNNDSALGAVYGKLYNWYAVAEIAKNPPAGWRVPSKADFTQLINYLGGLTVAGKKLKALFGLFNDTNSTNESGFSAIPGGLRVDTGAFGFANWGEFRTNSEWTMLLNESNSEAALRDYLNSKFGLSLRLLRNSPVGQAEETISQTIVANTDYTSTALQMPMKFGYRTSLIRITSENELTSVEVKLHNSAGTAVATLITAKSVAAGVTMVFPVLADYATLLNDGTLRMTAVGNVGSTVGGKFEATCQKEIFS